MPSRPLRTCAPESGVDRLLLVLFLLLAMLVGIWGSSASASDDSPFSPSWYVVLDWANLLDESQEQSAINDTWRLNTLGVPIQVVTELAETTPALASQRADQLRIDHGIETAEGADDGLLIYAAVLPSDRSQITMTVSVGANALPHGGLDQSDVDTIVSRIMIPQLTSGHPARAIVYSVREMIYVEMFTPPSEEPVDGWRRTLNRILAWVAPITSVAAVGIAGRKISTVDGFSKAAIRIAPLLGLALVLGVLSVASRSTAGAFSTIGLLVASVILSMLADRSIERRAERTIVVSPRPPGRFTSRGSEA